MQLSLTLSRSWVVVLMAGVSLILLLALVLYRPVEPGRFAPHPDPVQSYSEAEQRIQALWGQEAEALNPACRTQFLSHGHRVERAIVFVHGYTTCPQQFAELGGRFFQAGYNVLIVPLPWHGLADRMTDAHAQLTAEQLAAYGDAVVDIAQGLGEHVTFAGLSAGGLVTGWAAQNRADVDLAVLISPGFGFASVPPELTLPAMNLYLLLPNAFEWWDPERKEAVGPEYAYPRYSRYGLAQLLQLSQAVQAQARQSGPKAGAILVVTNASDTVVSAPLIRQVVGLWEQHGTRPVRTYEFDAELHLGHDLIDPTQSDQRIDIVYPKLLELISE
jgi:carboxylesterase